MDNTEMDLAKLTEYQLYELIQNAKLDKEIRTVAKQEFDRRKLTYAQIQDISLKHEAQFAPDKDEPLELRMKLYLLFWPFTLGRYFAGIPRYLSKGQKRKWKEYWLFMCLGYLLWTIIVILIGREVFRHR
jgi:hypothetical protein